MSVYRVPVSGVCKQRFHHNYLGMELDRNIIPSLVVLPPPTLFALKPSTFWLNSKWKSLGNCFVKPVRQDENGLWMTLFSIKPGWEVPDFIFHLLSSSHSFWSWVLAHVSYLIRRAPSKSEFSLRMHQSLCSPIKTLKLFS